MLTQFAEDLFHPNDHGYRVWASAFLPEVTARMAARFPRRPRKVETATERGVGSGESADVSAASGTTERPAASA
ncbi:hypothetical protein [Leifsonia poae]|uniref:hypothetical protein n=1 Tax=Leifsonia poae TaxID=110933 RepID=UPI003D665596